jgi:hypothetical protein
MMSDIRLDMLGRAKNNHPNGLDLDDSSDRRRRRADGSCLPGRSDATVRSSDSCFATNHQPSLTGKSSPSVPVSKRVNF